MAQVLERAQTTLQKWGNSQGVRIPKELCEQAGITVGSPVVIEYDSGVISIRAVRERPRYAPARKVDLDELFAGYEGVYRGEEWLDSRVGDEGVA